MPSPTATFILDIVDKSIKFLALCIGGLWTFWNFRKSRTYEQKLDLQLNPVIFLRSGSLYVDITASLKNLGSTKHSLQSEGTSCELLLVRSDLSEQSIRIFPVFSMHNKAEPGETISDRLLWKIAALPEDIVWARINLRVVSGEIEWDTTSVARIPVAQPGTKGKEEL